MVTATSDLAERLTRADSSYWHSWGEAVRDLHENPHGVEVFRFGRVSALHVHSAPVPVFNRVLGIDEHDTTLIDDILALYGERLLRHRPVLVRPPAPQCLERAGSASFGIPDDAVPRRPR